MRLIAAALIASLAALPAQGQVSPLPSGVSQTDGAALRSAISTATWASFCEWRSIGWAQDYILFLAREVGARSSDLQAGTSFVIATKDAAAAEIMAGDLRGNCARRLNPAALLEMDRARGEGRLPSLTTAR